MSETTSYHFLKNHTEEGEEEREGKEHEKKILIQEENASRPYRAPYSWT